MYTQEHVWNGFNQRRHMDTLIQADRSKSRHRRINLSEHLLIYQRKLCSRRNAAVSSSYQDTTDQNIIFTHTHSKLPAKGGFISKIDILRLSAFKPENLPGKTL